MHLSGWLPSPACLAAWLPFNGLPHIPLLNLLKTTGPLLLLSLLPCSPLLPCTVVTFPAQANSCHAVQSPLLSVDKETMGWGDWLAARFKTKTTARLGCPAWLVQPQRSWRSTWATCSAYFAKMACLRGFMVRVRVPSSMANGTSSTAKARTCWCRGRPASTRATSPCSQGGGGQTSRWVQSAAVAWQGAAGTVSTQFAAVNNLHCLPGSCLDKLPHGAAVDIAACLLQGFWRWHQQRPQAAVAPPQQHCMRRSPAGGGAGRLSLAAILTTSSCGGQKGSVMSALPAHLPADWMWGEVQSRSSSGCGSTFSPLESTIVSLARPAVPSGWAGARGGGWQLQRWAAAGKVEQWSSGAGRLAAPLTCDHDRTAHAAALHAVRAAPSQVACSHGRPQVGTTAGVFFQTTKYTVTVAGRACASCASSAASSAPLTCVKPPAVVPQGEGCSGGLVIAPIPLHHLGACRHSPGMRERMGRPNPLIPLAWRVAPGPCAVLADHHCVNQWVLGFRPAQLAHRWP